jgi:hypothetical protein
MEAFSFILKHKAALSAPQKDNINIEVDGKKIDTMEEFIAYAEGRKAGWNDHIRALSPNAVVIPREPTVEICEAMGEAITGSLPLTDMRLTLSGLAGYHAYKALFAILSQYGEQK